MKFKTILEEVIGDSLHQDLKVFRASAHHLNEEIFNRAANKCIVDPELIMDYLTEETTKLSPIVVYKFADKTMLKVALGKINNVKL